MEIRVDDGPAAVASCLRWDKAMDRRVILTCLIVGAKKLEKDRQLGRASPSTSSWWKSFHYEIVDLKQLMGANFILLGDGHIDLVVYKCMSQLSQHSQGPKYVVALRGTSLSVISDLKHDLKIVLQVLHTSPRFRQVLEVVTRLVEDHGHANLCVCGHSLGAALGLMAARKLAAEGLPIECHFFSPPFPTVSVPDAYKPTSLRGVLRILYPLTCTAFNVLLKDKQTRSNIAKEFASVAAWTPNLYINVNDPLCSGYVQYFDNHLKLARSAIGSFVSSVGAPYNIGATLRENAEPLHLVPSACLHRSEQGQGFMDCHRLAQWLNLHLPVESAAVSVVVR